MLEELPKLECFSKCLRWIRIKHPNQMLGVDLILVVDTIFVSLKLFSMVPALISIYSRNNMR